MARDNDGNGIGSVSKTHGTAGIRVPDSPGQLSVGNRLAIRNLDQFLPDFLLEGGALRRELEMKTLEFPGKVRAQLRADFQVGSVVPLPLRLRLARMTIAWEVDLREPAFAGYQEKSSYR